MTANEMIKARFSLNMTRDEFANKLGVSIRTVFYWEEGKRNPGKPVLLLLDQIMKQKES